ncbi:aldehyde dehydrogenase family protein [Clostridium kluyveri]|uniref:Aldehyde dehydrogenase n=1 Tax=Clostridium kluyveri TaxID=1534 RepID=A0A1L5F900_CLOKL|nr:aldehyde dehydrogenase family protein [Clostridium kluyveri]APM39462.1 aldehyde dehydrogenase family protein [Clostridium kluyveri]UZQ50409.1 aldehyde dehydrogenase family protein [Clostridium kluyveri]
MDINLIEIKKEMDRIFNLQINNKWKLRRSSARDRIKKLKMLKNYIINCMDEIEKALYDDFKKPGEEVLLTEVYPVIWEINHAIKNLHKWMKDKKVKTPITYFGAVCKIKYESKGVSLIISPWNFPFQLAISPLVSAIAAGNCVILKPSEYTPLTGKCIKKMISCIFQEDEVAVFQGDYRISKMLLEKPFENIFFTGSPTVGKMVMEAAAKNLATVTLELGGKSPVIIHPSANLDEAARRIAWGKCLNAGQICVAPDYLLIPQNKEEVFVELMIKYIIQYYGTFKKDMDNLKYSRIITKEHFFRIKELVEEAVYKGAKVRCGGYFNEYDNFIYPTIITDVDLNSKLLEEEIFGPVLPVISYKSMDEALEYIKSKPKPLVIYIFSRDKKAVNYLLDNTESGDAVINDVVVHAGNINLPFGGFNNSGIGKSHGYYGFMAFTHERSYMKQGKISLLSMVYPPFDTRTKKIIRKLIKYF